MLAAPEATTRSSSVKPSISRTARSKLAARLSSMEARYRALGADDGAGLGPYDFGLHG